MLRNFDEYNIGNDPYENEDLPNLPISGELPKEIKLSIMMSVFHRRTQLYRTLYSLTKQNFRDFEVLICDNNDDQNIEEVLELFKDVLEIVPFKIRGGPKQFDPTPNFNLMYGFARGDVIAIMQPECMLANDACWHLYRGHYDPEFWAYKQYKIKDTFEAPDDGQGETCVTLKTLWIDEKAQRKIDSVEWWKDVRKLYDLPDFESIGGLGANTNAVWAGYTCQLWWLVFSFKRDASIWDAMQKFDYLRGHASIDFLLINLRDLLGYRDIMPVAPLAFHQDHHRMSVAPAGEQETVSKQNIKERLENDTE
jgi:glycosyltransferase involved in cell wall biosynthesis